MTFMIFETDNSLLSSFLIIDQADISIHTKVQYRLHHSWTDSLELTATYSPRVYMTKCGTARLSDAGDIVCSRSAVEISMTIFVV